MSLVVVVLPFVPDTAIIGILADDPGGYSISITGSATFLGSPSVGSRCIRKPGAALTSSTAPPLSLIGVERSEAIISIPQILRPMIRAIRSHINTLVGCTKSVTSVAVPPVLRLAVGLSHNSSFFFNTVSRVYSFFASISIVKASTFIAVSTFSCP